MLSERPWSPRLIPVALLAGAALALLLLFGLARLAIEWQWFAQFGLQAVVLRRWLLQLLAFSLVFGLGLWLQLQQLQRCWRLRQAVAQKQLPKDPILRLGSPSLVACLTGLLLALALGLSYLFIQAKGLISSPFSDEVITGLAGASTWSPLWVAGVAMALIGPLLIWPLTSLRLALTAALAIATDVSIEVIEGMAPGEFMTGLDAMLRVNAGFFFSWLLAPILRAAQIKMAPAEDGPT